MNYNFLILRNIYESKNVSQRDLSEQYKISLGKVNSILKKLVEQNFLQKNNNKHSITEDGMKELEKHKVESAVILAAGKGVRFAPLTYDTPKGLIKVKNERMIERQIIQLKEKNINDITIIVGYLKEKFEYLIDKYNVKLLYNSEYDTKNTISSLRIAKNIFTNKNSYLLVSDNYITENIFHEFECETWYATTFMQGKTNEWKVETDSKNTIKTVTVGGCNCDVMYGPSFFTKDFSKQFFEFLENYYKQPGTDNYYWEDVFVKEIKNLPNMFSYNFPNNIIYEFESVEELRKFDKSYDENSGSIPMKYVANFFNVKEKDIKNISCTKNGMTNKSWTFNINNDSYICRVPGEGSNEIINRKQEKKVYDILKKSFPDLIEEVVDINDKTGFKIAKYYNKTHSANINSDDDVLSTMMALKKLHNSGIKVDWKFDLLEKLNLYEELINKLNGEISFEDFDEQKKKFTELYKKIEHIDRPNVFCQIDANVDNILFTNCGVKLIDWEYASMQDPILDIAMFCIYSFLDFDKSKNILEIYNKIDIENNYSNIKNINKEENENLLIAYMGLSGFVWALWALYKEAEGVKFGEYAILNYRYFKNAYKYLKERKFF